MSILDQLLKKRITDARPMDEEEKATYERWRKVLAEGEITVDRISEFCRGQMKVIENKWRQNPHKWEENAHLVPMHTVYSTLLDAIAAPAKERERLEEYLNSLLQ